MYVIGQRWLNSQQPELGLGLVTEVQGRQVALYFPLVDSDARYASESAPLLRFTLDVGECAQDINNRTFEVISSDEDNGLMSYEVEYPNGARTTLFETQIAHHLQINQPEKRLFNGQINHTAWFDVRHQTYQAQYKHNTHPGIGLLGARMTPLEHQVNIVQQVGQRFAPRVLLADEVGLGKTIEAAMILHKQILLGRCQRALIIVPESLQHQWLVELHRRINMMFSLFDEERLEALSDENDNPWLTAQWVITNVSTLQAQPQALQQLCETPWDCLIVDEAHHLTEQGSHNSEYEAIAKLCQLIPSVLLLTATPDQQGSDAHFAQLQLLDPNRFTSAEQFHAEQASYQALADLSDALLSCTQLDHDLIARCHEFLPELSISDIADKSVFELIQELIDRHGTGRLFYRNTRKAIGHANARQVIAHPLDSPEEYTTIKDRVIAHIHEDTDWVKDWLEQDPKVNWLLEFLQNARGKTLLICRTARAVLELAEHIRIKRGISLPVFHEQMSISERDRAAHFFADDEDGAPMLLCSEIGSEGRNFQFCQQLILFDLPLNPDLLEQRIGRLDRIGQTSQVEIIVPFHRNSAQERLFRFFDVGLNAFNQTCTVGNEVLTELGQPLAKLIQDPDFDAELPNIASLTKNLVTAQEQGRNKLLELNAKGFDQHADIIAALDDEAEGEEVYQYLSSMADVVGFKFIINDHVSYVIQPTEDLLYPLQTLPDEGMTVTFSRRVATAREDYHFISFEHPFVRELMATLLSDNTGKASIGLFSDSNKPVGAFIVQCQFVIQAASQAEHNPYLTPQSFVVSCDHANQIFNETVESIHRVKKVIAAKLITALAAQIKQAIRTCENTASEQAVHIKNNALQHMQLTLGTELERLHYLQHINPAVRPEEISILEAQLREACWQIENAPVNLDSIRVLVNNPQ